MSEETMDKIDPHILNARLAEIIGKKVREEEITIENVLSGEVSYIGTAWLDEEGDTWNPCMNAQDMETVKAWLREKGYELMLTIKRDVVFATVFGVEAGMWEDSHQDELLALAQAVVAMME